MAKDKVKRKTSEEAKQIVMDLRFIDDVLFEKLAEDAKAVQEILRVILEMPKLCVKENSLVAQKRIQNIAKRSVRLDAYVEGCDDVVYNIEIQRANSCNHVKRVRYNASCITVDNSEPGDEFEHVQDVIVVYISEFDIFKAGKTIYHTKMTVEETGEIVSDGFKAVYVNTAVDDGTVIAKLMKHFMEPDFADSNFPEMSRRIAELKHNEQEVIAMCKSVQDYADKVAAEAAAEGRAELIENMLRSGMTPEQIAEVCKIDLEEVKKVEESLLASAK